MIITTCELVQEWYRSAECDVRFQWMEGRITSRRYAASQQLTRESQHSYKRRSKIRKASVAIMQKIFRLVGSILTFGFVTACSLPTYTAGEVPYVPTPMNVVDRMLALADIKPGDVVYDLGSGDGRIVIEA